MEFTVVEGLRTLKLDLVLTLGLAALFLFAGGWLQRRVPAFSRASIPAAAIGGLLFAGLVWALRARGVLGVTLDTTLRAPLQTAFFTTIGLGATVSLLRAGGGRLVFFFVLASLLGVVQNLVGIGVAAAVGAPKLLGVICGSLTLTGGPATGAAFAPLFEQKGIVGAGAIAIASATFGIFVSSLVGNPVATALIRRYRLKPATAPARDEAGEQFWAIGSTAAPEEADAPTDRARLAHDDERETTPAELLRSLLLILLAMGLGALLSLMLTWLGTNIPPAVGVRVARFGESLLSRDGGIVDYTGGVVTALGWWLYKFRFILPGYVGAMIVAAAARYLDDRTGWLGLSPRAVEALGTIALALFLVIALMDLKLWQLAGLAVPMAVILSAQIVLTILFAVFVTYVLMGRDYEAAVTASGHVGFGLGITPNAVANMEALTARFGPAPRSFLVVPVVGAFFIDFSNALIITTFANFFG